MYEDFKLQLCSQLAIHSESLIDARNGDTYVRCRLITYVMIMLSRKTVHIQRERTKAKAKGGADTILQSVGRHAQENGPRECSVHHSLKPLPIPSFEFPKIHCE